MANLQTEIGARNREAVLLDSELGFGERHARPPSSAEIEPLIHGNRGFRPVESRIGASACKVFDIDIQARIESKPGLLQSSASGFDLSASGNHRRGPRLSFLERLGKRKDGGQRFCANQGRNKGRWGADNRLIIHLGRDGCGRRSHERRSHNGRKIGMHVSRTPDKPKYARTGPGELSVVRPLVV
ncbi:hypothetical protein AEB_P0780 [Altererythrobacter sp. B11]|nr:hypothetical protein AEB_P0780 [Altererythrobacter sp. B11]